MFPGDVTSFQSVDAGDAPGKNSVEQVALDRRDIQLAQRMLDGSPCLAGVTTAFNQRPAYSSLLGERMRPGGGRRLQIAGVEQLACFADVGVIHGAGSAEHQCNRLVIVALENGPANKSVIAPNTEALGPEVVGQATCREHLHDWFRPGQR